MLTSEPAQFFIRKLTFVLSHWPSQLAEYGGEGGIRTLEAFRLTHFPGVLLRPLGHLTEIFNFIALEPTLHYQKKGPAG